MKDIYKVDRKNVIFFEHGETCLKMDIKKKHDVAVIHCDWRCDQDTMIIAQMNDMLRGHYDTIELVLPYMPYGRQDRASTQDTAFSLKCFADIINGMDFDNVHTLDPHSDVQQDLFKSLVIESNAAFIGRVLECIDNPIVVSPDKGASMKIEETLSGTGVDFIQGGKIRDPSTGALTGFSLEDGEMLKGRNVLIVDDICCKGGTFLGLLSIINTHEPKSVSLAVTHMDSDYGSELMSNAFNAVYCTHESAGCIVK